MVKLFFILVWCVLMVRTNPAIAGDDILFRSGRTGKLAVGIERDMINSVSGLSAKYWISETLGIHGSYSLGKFNGYSFSAIFGGSTFPMLNKSVAPYFRLGYASLSLDDPGPPGLYAEVTDSGVHLFWGIEGTLTQLLPNFYWTGEVGYSSIEFGHSVTAPSPSGGTLYYFDGPEPYSGWSLLISGIYYFNY